MQKSRNLILSLLAGLVCLAGCVSARAADAKAPRSGTADDLVLVKGGKPLAPIVVASNAPPMTRQAAEDLATYIGKISGAKPEVITNAPGRESRVAGQRPAHAGPLPERAIWVGYQPKLKELFPKIDFDFKHPEEILIACDGKNIVILGRDRWDPEHMELDLGKVKIAGVQSEYGSANAVYTFLQDYLDVRWLWPGELGEDIVQKDTLAFAPFEYRYHPQILSRAGIFVYSRLGRQAGYGNAHEWARCQRLQLDSLSIEGGHGFHDWWDRFHEAHPDYFALQPDGTRGGGKKPYPSAGTVKMCKSNPAVWDQWMQEVERQLKENPNQTVFNAAANDSWASGYCVCTNCRAWDHPEGELRMYNWQGFSQEYVAISDRQVTFANTLARKLKARYPDKDYYVSIFAYGHSRPAPLAAVPASNVIVSCVANILLRPNQVDSASPNGTLHRDQFRDWGKVAPNLFWRPNKARKMSSMPHIPVRQTIRDFRFVAENHCIGIYVDMVWGHWATRGPLYYAMAQMAWDPYRDGDAMLDDYYRRAFGAAADDMRAYWDLMEKKCEQSWEKDYDYPELFDEEFFKQAYATLERADRSAKNAPEIYRKRIKFVRIGLDYARLVTEARRMMVRFEKSGGKDQEAEDRARAIWVEEIMPLATGKEYPCAINWGPARPGHGHKTAGCYPADLDRKKW